MGRLAHAKPRRRGLPHSGSQPQAPFTFTPGGEHGDSMESTRGNLRWLLEKHYEQLKALLEEGRPAPNSMAWDALTSPDPRVRANAVLWWLENAAREVDA